MYVMLCVEIDMLESALQQMRSQEMSIRIT